MNKLFIATSNFYRIDPKIIKIFKKKKISIKYNPLKRKLTNKEIIKFALDASYIIAGTENYNKDVIKKLKNLKYIFRLGAGLDNLDLDFLRSKKIKYSSSSITPQRAVSELIVSYILSLYRNLYLQNNEIKKGIWKKRMGHILNGKTVGIIGYGKIGRYLKKILNNFGVEFLIYDKKKYKNVNSSLKQLVEKSDIITLNVSLLNKKKILDKHNLKKVKKNSIIINTSRPEVLDYEYLYYLLKEKKIFGAGLDVFPQEPYYGKFRKLDNVVLTPHIGSYAKEIRVNMEQEAIIKILSL